MNFFTRVLPSTGSFILLTGVTGPDGKLAEPRHYSVQTIEELEQKIKDLSTHPLNIFFAVGSYTGANRRDPIAKRAFWLDLDSKDFEGSIPNALRALSVFVTSTGLPPPSVYVQSGHGVHVYWCLDKDIPVAEWVPIAKALKAKCKELDFAADASATADPARVLRAPTTLNRKGPTPLPCRVLGDNGSTYPLARIANQLGLNKSSAIDRLKLLGADAEALKTKAQYRDLKAEEIRGMLDVIHLPTINSRDQWTVVLMAVQDWCDKSEEGWDLFHEWCITQPGYSDPEQVRREWDSFNPGGGIGTGSLVKMAQDAGYVPPGTPDPVAPASLTEQVAAPSSEGDEEQQIVAPSTISDPLMITAQYTVNATGKVRFDKDSAIAFLSNEFVLITEQEGVFYSISTRQLMTARVIDDLLTRYMPLNANGLPIEATKFLRRYGVRHSVQAPGFHPSAPSIFVEDGKTYVNQYVAPEDPLQGTQAEIQLIENFWQYMFPTDDDQAFSDYVKNCFAMLVKHPDQKIDSALLVVSPEQGTGKTTLAYEIPKRLVGTNNTKMISNKTLRGSFSGYLNGTKFLHFDEVHINGRWDSDDTANSLKSLVAGSTVEVTPKYMNSFNIRNRVWISATSNYEDAMNLPNESERRWAVYAHAPIRVWTKDQKEAYFKILYKWLNSARAPGVLRWYFDQTDITGFNPAAPPPVTGAKKRMVGKSQTREIRIIADAIEHSEAPFNKELVTNDAVRQFLHSETGKIYSAYETREFLHRAVPRFIALPQLRTGTTRLRPLAWKNFVYWSDPARTAAEIKQELG